MAALQAMSSCRPRAWMSFPDDFKELLLRVPEEAKRQRITIEGFLSLEGGPVVRFRLKKVKQDPLSDN